MATGTRLRQHGQRQTPNVRSRSSASVLSNSMGVPGAFQGEHRLNLQQVWALEHMFEGNPAVKAARTVLSGQLLSGGISLRKEGEDVELTAAFKDHLNEAWIPFAQDVIDCFLKWGLAPVVYEEYDDDLRKAAIFAKRRKLQQQQAQQQQTGKSKAARAAAAAPAVDPPVLLVPMVPSLGSYEIAFRMGGRQGYKREYYVYATSPSTGLKVDEEARVVVRQHPDVAGNVNSPLASVFELGSFVAALTELAMVAESSRARPRIVTQMAKKTQSALDPGNLFFDSESRAVQAGADLDESASQARALQLQHQMCAVINRLQTTAKGPDQDAGSFSRSGMSSAAGKTSYAPPEVNPSLFNIPKDQELTTGGSNPESRGDLEGLTRLSIEQFCSAFGIPSELLYSGERHPELEPAASPSALLSLLNITVSQLAKAVNGVLTIAYRDIYASSPDEDVGQLQLLTSPLSATDEVLQLYQGGLVPIDIAMPSVLHSIGATKDEIDHALADAKKKEGQTNGDERDQQSFTKDDNNLSLEMKAVELESRKKALEHPAAAEDK